MFKSAKKNGRVKKNFYGVAEASIWSEWQSTDSCWRIENLEETIVLGQTLIQRIPELRLILLEGPLGAGKTSLVKGMAIGLDITEPITSPTFPLAQRYFSGKPPLFHLDLYRLENHITANELFIQEEEDAKGLNALIVVEWPERLSLSLKEAWRIKIEYCNGEKRLVHVIPPKLPNRNDLTSS